MARRGGFGGANMGQMMKQVQKMQADMQKAQAEIEATTVNASSGGGMVEVEMNGKKEVLSIKIDEAAVDPEDVEMLEDMVLTAVNDAIKQVEDLTESKMGKFTSGMPGLF